MKFILFAIFASISLFSSAQQKDTTNYYYDTAKTFAWYINDLTTGNSTTSYVFRVVKSKIDFMQPSPEELKHDSFMVKKQKVNVDVLYYVPVLSFDSTASRKAKKQITKITYSLIPKDLIIFDAQRNFDYLIPKKDNVDLPKTDTNKLKKLAIPRKN